MIQKFSDIFLPMDNKKGKKGKLFFRIYFITINNNKIYFYAKIFMTELVLDNEKGKHFNINKLYDQK